MCSRQIQNLRQKLELTAKEDIIKDLQRQGVEDKTRIKDTLATQKTVKLKSKIN